MMIRLSDIYKKICRSSATAQQHSSTPDLRPASRGLLDKQNTTSQHSEAITILRLRDPLLSFSPIIPTHRQTEAHQGFRRPNASVTPTATSFLGAHHGYP
jgi:hypothetical protein